MVYKSNRCLRSSLSTQSDTDLSNNSSPLLADMFLEVSSLAAKSGFDILVPVSKLPEQRQGVDETTFSLLDCQHRRQQQNGIIHAKIKNLSSFSHPRVTANTLYDLLSSVRTIQMHIPYETFSTTTVYKEFCAFSKQAKNYNGKDKSPTLFK